MAGIYIDGFDWGTVLADRWDTVSSGVFSGGGTAATDVLSTGRWGSGNYLRTDYRLNGGSQGNACYVSRALGANVATLTIGLALRYRTDSAKDQPLLGLADGTTRQVDVRVNSSNQLYVTRNGTVLGTSPIGGPGVLVDNTWVYVEFKVTFSGTVGVIELRVNGTTTIGPTSSLNTIVTANAYANRLYLGHYLYNAVAGVAEAHYDDVYVLSSTGGGPSSFLGERRCLVQTYSGAGTNSAFAQTGGTGGQPYTALASDDGDTSYLASNSVGAKHTFAVTALAVNVTGIDTVQLTPIARKDDAGFRHLAAHITQGATETTVGDYNLGSTYTGLSGQATAMRDTDPTTGVAWTRTGFNAAEFGFEVLS